MDPDRVRAYLQVACAGLGFDIGEIWWSNNDSNGTSSALAAIEETDDTGSALVSSSQSKKLRFVQLYTSKSYEKKRDMLVRPSDEEENYNSQVNGEKEEDNAADHKKHVLSPTLVDAISKTAQVVWAHTRKSEGLTGRSDMRLQTAVGMPVAVDREGNMCVVVMFSPNNISSTDDAMEYLQSISRSATSTSIPALLPAFDPKQGLIALPHHHQSTNDVLPMLKTVLDDGVSTRFVSLDENPLENQQLSIPEVHSDQDLQSAPRDCFGIPMLPAAAELASSAPKRSEEFGETVTDAFDEASYGVWSTIMQTLDQPLVDETAASSIAPVDPAASIPPSDISTVSSNAVTTFSKPFLAMERQERLEEFASAFLGVSVFDLAEVWLPLGNGADALGLVTSVTSDKDNASLNEVTNESKKLAIKYWSGAIGRAFSSGNPVWSHNRDVFADASRVRLFEQAKIETALAVPVFSGKTGSPAFVFSCYSFVPTGSVPFVLKFVQQALKLLWGGLDKVQPHSSVGEELWRDVEPADLGEMAADVEMQQHFIIKKRPIAAITNEPSVRNDVDDKLAARIETLEGPSGTPVATSIYTGGRTTSDYGSTAGQSEADFSPSVQPVQYQTFESVQNHIQDAIRSVGDMQPVHQHIATNATGSKRAHVFQQQAPLQSYLQQSQPQQQQFFTQPQPQQQQPMSFMQQQQPTSQPVYMQQPQQQAQVVYPPQQQQAPQFVTVQANQQQQQQQQPMQGFLSAAPAPLARPMALPNQVLNSQSEPNFAAMPRTQRKESADSLSEMLNDPSLLQPTPTYTSDPIPDRPMENLHLGATPQQFQQQQFQQQQQQFQQQVQQQQQQQVQQQSHTQQLFNNHIPTVLPPQMAMQQAEPLPNPVYSVPVDQLSKNGISFGPLPIQPQQQVNNNNMNVAAQNQTYCMPASQSGQASATGTGKSCRIQGCNDPAVPRRPYCVRHSGNRMCEHQGCTKCAQGSTRFCIAHGGGRRCTFPGCDKGARDKFFCAAHGGGKRCKFDGCSKSAVGGSSLCTAHGGGRRCAVDGCDKSAQSSTKYCVKHGGGKKCCHPGCEKVARGRTQFCAAHGGGVRCKLAGCNRVAIGKLQLCRAHGGGARPKNTPTTMNGGVAAAASAQQQQMNPMFGQDI